MRVPMEDKMKILIAGDGKVGASLTRELTAAGYDITLIDSKQNVLDSSIERFDVMAIRGIAHLWKYWKKQALRMRIF